MSDSDVTILYNESSSEEETIPYNESSEEEAITHVNEHTTKSGRIVRLPLRYR